MKIDGLDWMDWLHKLRERREKDRLEKGISEEEWLRQSAARAAEFKARCRQKEQPSVARDRKPEAGQP